MFFVSAARRGLTSPCRWRKKTVLFGSECPQRLHSSGDN
jgi:hypothetical protein